MSPEGRLVSNTDGTIRLKPGPFLIQFIKDTLHKDDALPSRLKALIDDPNTLLEIDDLRWIRARMPFESLPPVVQSTGDNQNANPSPQWFFELIDGCEIQLPEPIRLPRDPQLEARVQRLREEQNSREYYAMTKNVDCVRYQHPEDTIAYQMKQINRQLIAVAQFVISVAAGFAFGFVGVELIVGSLDFGFRILLGVMCALIIALAEIYFLAKKLSEDDYHVYEPVDEHDPKSNPITPVHTSTSKKPHQD